jgi:chemotaxis protein MotB
MALSRNRRDRSVDYWPGFVDALSTLLLTFMFLLSVFVLAQFFLSREISGKDEVLNRLNSQIAELTNLLALEKTNAQDVQDQILSLQASLESSETEKTRLKTLLEAGSGKGAEAELKLGEATKTLDAERQVSQRALAQVELLNQQLAALRKQIGALEDALNASETRDKESGAKIADLGKRLNVALAQRVQELNRYRSDFFGRLREILSDRDNIRIVGDRFVFQSEVLFPSGAAEINEAGKGEMLKLANHRTRQGNSAGNQLGPARRRPHRHGRPLGQRKVRGQLGTLLRPRDSRRQIPHSQRRPRRPAGGRRLRRISAARHRRHTRSARQEPED